MNIDECFEIADYLQQTEPVDYEEQRKGASAIWWLIEQNRQQQARINELEKLMSDMKYEKSSGVYELSEEKIANVWLFLEGKSEGVLELGGTFNFPLEFYKAIKELEK